MTELDQPNRRAQIDLAPELVPAFMAHMAEFVSQHNLSLHFVDATDPTFLSEAEIRAKFNPNRFTWMIDSISNKRLPVITLQSLVQFESEHKSDRKGIARRTGNGLLSNLRIKPEEKAWLRAYLVVPPAFIEGTTNNAIGIRAEYFQNMVSALQSGNFKVTDIGKEGIYFLKEYLDDFLKPPHSSDMTV